jgi:hypothetical protein
VQTAWTGLFVQLFGLVFGFLLSLWAAVKIAPHLTIESPFVISFIFALLVFSNIWTILNAQILRLINFWFPNLYFKRAGRESPWLNGILITLVGALVLYLLNMLWGWIGGVLGTFVGK